MTTSQCNYNVTISISIRYIRQLELLNYIGISKVSMLTWVFFLHLVIVASPFHPHSRLSWICAWTSSFVQHAEFRPFLRCLLLC